MQSFGAILLIAAYFAFSLTSLIIYTLIGEGIPLIVLFGIQNIIIIILLLGRALWIKKSISKPKNMRWIFLRSCTGSLYSLSYYTALSYASFAEVGLLTNSFPLFIVLFAWLFLGERVTIMQWISLSIGLIGVWAILGPNVANFNNAGILFATLASVFWAISLIIMQKVTDYEDFYTYLLYFFSFNLVLLSPFILYYFQFPTPKQLFFCSVTAIISLIGQSLIFHAYKLCSAAELAPYNFSFAFFHFLLAKGMFNFMPTTSFYIGAGLIFLGGVINLILFERRAPEEEAIPVEVSEEEV